MTDERRCNATIWKRDTYRRTGRTASGFELHFNRCRCSRQAVYGDLCRQHMKIEATGMAVTRYKE